MHKPPAKEPAVVFGLWVADCTALANRLRNAAPSDRILARELPFLCQWTKTEPGLHRTCELTASRQYHSTIRQRGAHSIESHPYRRHAAQIHRHIKIDLESGIDRAQINADLGIDNQPPAPLRSMQFRVHEFDDVAARRHRRGI